MIQTLPFYSLSAEDLCISLVVMNRERKNLNTNTLYPWRIFQLGHTFDAKAVEADNFTVSCPFVELGVEGERTPVGYRKHCPSATYSTELV